MGFLILNNQSKQLYNTYYLFARSNLSELINIKRFRLDLSSDSTLKAKSRAKSDMQQFCDE
jgi:hypothetical protein